MESKAMVAVQESWPVSGASLPVGEPVTLVIEDERFFGWVAPEAQAHKQNPQSARRNNFSGEQIFRWVLLLSENLSASNYPGAAHSLVCVAIEFTRGGTRVRERIPVENIQRLRDYLQVHPELRQAKEQGACTMPSPTAQC
jgi:hypothetical protein